MAMRYSTDEALNELTRRASALRRRRERAITSALSVASATLSVLLVAAIAAIDPFNGLTVRPAAYGAYLLPSEAGGYVLVGVVAFMLGVVFVVLFSRRRDRVSRMRDGSEEK